MDLILNNKGAPIRDYTGTSEDECIIGTNKRNLIYGEGGSVRKLFLYDS